MREVGSGVEPGRGEIAIDREQVHSFETVMDATRNSKLCGSGDCLSAFVDVPRSRLNSSQEVAAAQDLTNRLERKKSSIIRGYFPRMRHLLTEVELRLLFRVLRY